MKNNTPSASESIAPLIWKLILIGSGILIVVMIFFTVRSLVRIFRPLSSSSAVTQINTETVVVNPKPSASTPLSSASDNSPLSAPNNSHTAASPANRPVSFIVQNKIIDQRKKARAETIEALKREAQERAGTSGVPKEALQKLEQSNPIPF